MKKITTLLILTTTLLYSCNPFNKSSSHTFTKTTVSVVEEESLTESYHSYIDTKFQYINSKQKKLIIENSLPKGGLKYTDQMGREYIYAVFWTRITNKTDHTFNFSLNFSADSLTLSSSPDNNFKLFIPSDKMTLDKAPLENYGISNLANSLKGNLQTSSLLQDSLPSNKSSLFYVITLFKKGVSGTLRTGLFIKDENLIYKVNEKEINCGKHNFKNLKLN